MTDKLMALLPCPFCGEPAELDTDQGFRHYGNGRLLSQVAVYCTGCGVAHANYRGDLGLDHEDTVAVTVEAWNRRTELPALIAEVERLREALATIDAGAERGKSDFAARMNGKKSLTWFAVNVLQDNLAACGGTARAALAGQP